MNRAERRRAGKTKPQKTYVLTDAQIQQMKNEAVAEAFKLLIAIPCAVLHDKFGFGAIRQDRFTHYTFSWLDDIQQGRATLADVLKICEEEAGVTIQRRAKK